MSTSWDLVNGLDELHQYCDDDDDLFTEAQEAWEVNWAVGGVLGAALTVAIILCLALVATRLRPRSRDYEGKSPSRVIHHRPVLYYALLVLLVLLQDSLDNVSLGWSTRMQYLYQILSKNWCLFIVFKSFVVLTDKIDLLFRFSCRALTIFSTLLFIYFEGLEDYVLMFIQVY